VTTDTTISLSLGLQYVPVLSLYFLDVYGFNCYIVKIVFGAMLQLPIVDHRSVPFNKRLSFLKVYKLSKSVQMCAQTD
jgi:hypothetical protein